jgi:hypothetical protein
MLGRFCMASLLLSASLVTVSLTGCGDDSVSGGGGAGAGEPLPLPPLTKAPLTTEEILEPTHAAEPVGILNPRLAEDVEILLEDGYGDYTIGAGEPVLRRMMDGSTAPESGASPMLLSRFVHLADTQLADDESPARVLNVDSPMGLTGGAFRPQEGHECRVLNAAVRTINKIGESSPIDFVVLGGDNADNAQTNEIDWVLGILSGSDVVDCDSGIDDDPVAGANNDPKDPFIAPGLDAPWYWVTGNHDVLNQGNFPPLAKEAEYLGDYAAVGTRDWSQPGGPVILGEVAPDERRAPLTGVGVLSRVKADGDGHGMPDSAVASGRAFYSFDVEGTPLRVIVLDTAAPSGSAEGLIHQPEVDDFLVPELDAALAASKYVIVTSHHSSAQLTNGGGFGGEEQPDAVLQDDLREVLGGYPNLLMHLAGHTHHHRAVAVEPIIGAPYWEVETSALADFPHQMRLIELWNLDNGFLGIRMVAFDYQTEGDPIAEDGRMRGIMDFTSGWEGDGRGTLQDRNIELYVPLP